MNWHPGVECSIKISLKKTEFSPRRDFTAVCQKIMRLQIATQILKQFLYLQFLFSSSVVPYCSVITLIVREGSNGSVKPPEFTTVMSFVTTSIINHSFYLCTAILPHPACSDIICTSKILFCRAIVKAFILNA